MSLQKRAAIVTLGAFAIDNIRRAIKQLSEDEFSMMLDDMPAYHKSLSRGNLNPEIFFSDEVASKIPAIVEAFGRREKFIEISINDILDTIKDIYRSVPATQVVVQPERKIEIKKPDDAPEKVFVDEKRVSETDIRSDLYPIALRARASVLLSQINTFVSKANSKSFLGLKPDIQDEIYQTIINYYISLSNITIDDAILEKIGSSIKSVNLLRREDSEDYGVYKDFDAKAHSEKFRASQKEQLATEEVKVKVKTDEKLSKPQNPVYKEKKKQPSGKVIVFNEKQDSETEGEDEGEDYRISMRRAHAYVRTALANEIGTKTIFELYDIFSSLGQSAIIVSINERFDEQLKTIVVDAPVVNQDNFRLVLTKISERVNDISQKYDEEFKIKSLSSEPITPLNFESAKMINDLLFAIRKLDEDAILKKERYIKHAQAAGLTIDKSALSSIDRHLVSEFVRHNGSNILHGLGQIALRVIIPNYFEFADSVVENQKRLSSGALDEDDVRNAIDEQSLFWVKEKIKNLLKPNSTLWSSTLDDAFKHIVISRKLLSLNVGRRLLAKNMEASGRNIKAIRKSRCPVCYEIIDIKSLGFGRGQAAKSSESVQDSGMSDYDVVLYSSFKYDGSLIEDDQLNSGTFPPPPGISGDKSWSDIQSMIYSNDQKTHKEGVLRRAYALRSLGAKPSNISFDDLSQMRFAPPTDAPEIKGFRSLSEIRFMMASQNANTQLEGKLRYESAIKEIEKEVPIGSVRFKCPFGEQTAKTGSSKSSCGATFNVSSIDEGLSGIQTSWAGAIAGADRFNPMQSSAIITQPEDVRKKYDEFYKKMSSGGFKFSSRLVACPARISHDNIANDQNVLLKHNLVAFPHCGPLTKELLSGGGKAPILSGDVVREDMIVGLPTTPTGQLDNTMQPNTFAYLVCGSATSLSSFIRSSSDPNGIVSIFTKALMESEDRLSLLVDRLVSEGIDFDDIHPFVLKTYELVESRKTSTIINDDRLNKLAELLSFAMSKRIAEGDELFADLGLQCAFGHKFKVRDSWNFGTTHAAIKVGDSPGCLTANPDVINSLITSSGIEGFEAAKAWNLISKMPIDRKAYDYMSWKAASTASQIENLIIKDPATGEQYYFSFNDKVRGARPQVWNDTNYMKYVQTYTGKTWLPTFGSQTITLFTAGDNENADYDRGDVEQFQKHMQQEFAADAEESTDFGAAEDRFLLPGMESEYEQYRDQTEDAAQHFVSAVSSSLKLMKGWIDESMTRHFKLIYGYHDEQLFQQLDTKVSTMISSVIKSIPQVLKSIGFTAQMKGDSRQLGMDAANVSQFLLDKVSPKVIEDLDESFLKIFRNLQPGSMPMIPEFKELSDPSNMKDRIVLEVSRAIRRSLRRARGDININFPKVSDSDIDNAISQYLSTESSDSSIKDVVEVLTPKTHERSKFGGAGGEKNALILKDYYGRIAIISNSVYIADMIERLYNYCMKPSSPAYIGFDIGVDLSDRERILNISDDEISKIEDFQLDINNISSLQNIAASLELEDDDLNDAYGDNEQFTVYAEEKFESMCKNMYDAYTSIIAIGISNAKTFAISRIYMSAARDLFVAKLQTDVDSSGIDTIKLISGLSTSEFYSAIPIRDVIFDPSTKESIVQIPAPIQSVYIAHKDKLDTKYRVHSWNYKAGAVRYYKYIISSKNVPYGTSVQKLDIDKDGFIEVSGDVPTEFENINIGMIAGDEDAYMVSSNEYVSVSLISDTAGKKLRETGAPIYADPDTEVVTDDNGNTIYINRKNGYNSSAFQVGQLLQKEINDVYWPPIKPGYFKESDVPQSAKDRIKYAYFGGFVGVHIPGLHNWSTPTEPSSLPIYDYRIVVNINGHPYDISFLIKKHSRSFDLVTSEIEKTYDKMQSELQKVSEISSSPDEYEQVSAEIISKYKPIISRLNERLSRIQPEILNRWSSVIKSNVSRNVFSESEKASIESRPALSLVDPLTAYRMITKESFSKNFGGSQSLDEESSSDLIDFIMKVYNLGPIKAMLDKIAMDTIERTLTDDEFFNIDEFCASIRRDVEVESPVQQKGRGAATADDIRLEQIRAAKQKFLNNISDALGLKDDGRSQFIHRVNALPPIRKLWFHANVGQYFDIDQSSYVKYFMAQPSYAKVGDKSDISAIVASQMRSLFMSSARDESITDIDDPDELKAKDLKGSIPYIRYMNHISDVMYKYITAATMKKLGSNGHNMTHGKSLLVKIAQRSRELDGIMLAAEYDGAWEYFLNLASRNSQ